MRWTKASLALAAILAALVAAGFWFAAHTRTGQDWVLARSVQALVATTPVLSFDGLRVFVCGCASPLIAPGHAQACVGVLAGDDLYVVDAGMGAAGTFQFAGESLAPLRAILLTHFHSDHITGIPDLNLNSWVFGRPQPLAVMGPTGVERVVAGFNEALALDYGYRVAHHGTELLPPALGPMQAQAIDAGVVLQRDGLTITAFPVDHSPVHPAFGYRFDFRGRSVAVSGDTIVTESLRDGARNADLLLQDALSLPIIQALEAGATQAGLWRQAKIMADIPSYHAHTADMAALAESAGVRLLALYHLLPVPTNYLTRQMFRRDLPDDVVITSDGMVFELPAGSAAIHVREP